MEISRTFGTCRFAHHACLGTGQISFRPFGKTPEKIIPYCQIQNSVPQKLETFIVMNFQITMFIGIRGMGQCHIQQLHIMDRNITLFCKTPDFIQPRLLPALNPAHSYSS